VPLLQDEREAGRQKRKKKGVLFLRKGGEILLGGGNIRNWGGGAFSGRLRGGGMKGEDHSGISLAIEKVTSGAPGGKAIPS